MDIRKLQRAIVDGLEDVKAHDITVFNTEHLSPLFERVIIASGTSNRQTKALAASVRDAVRSSGFPVMRTEGEDNGEWIIVDCGAAVAHIMQPAIRQYYHLEEIWGDKPVRIKVTDGPRALPKASEPEPEPVPTKAKPAAKKAPAKAPAKKAPAKKLAAKRAPAKVPAKKAAAGAKAAPARKSPAAKSARPAAKSAARKPAAKTSAPRSAAAKTAAKKSTRGSTRRA